MAGTSFCCIRAPEGHCLLNAPSIVNKLYVRFIVSAAREMAPKHWTMRYTSRLARPNRAGPGQPSPGPFPYQLLFLVTAVANSCCGRTFTGLQRFPIKDRTARAADRWMAAVERCPSDTKSDEMESNDSASKSNVMRLWDKWN